MSPVETIVAIVVPFVSGGGVWAYLSSRQKARAPAPIAHSQADLVAALSEQTKVLLAESAKDRKDLKRRVDTQGREIRKLRTEVSDCRDHRDTCQSDLAAVRAQIDVLMSKPVPGYVLGEKANVPD